VSCFSASIESRSIYSFVFLPSFFPSHADVAPLLHPPGLRLIDGSSPPPSRWTTARNNRQIAVRNVASLLRPFLHFSFVHSLCYLIAYVDIPRLGRNGDRKIDNHSLVDGICSSVNLRCSGVSCLCFRFHPLCSSLPNVKQHLYRLVILLVILSNQMVYKW